MESIYKERIELTEKHRETLKAIEAGNKKEDKTPYDEGVLFDMLVANMKARKIGQEYPYPFEGMEDFDWETFEKDYEAAMKASRK